MFAVYEFLPVISTWILISLAVLVLYLVGTVNHDFYKKRNIPYIKPLPFLGNISPLLFRQMSACDFVLHLYNELRGHRYGGFFTFSNPRFMLRDPELIKAVCIRDFDHFTDRNTLLNADMEPIAGRVLASLNGEEWRYLRSIVSPAFSPSKIKDLCRDMSERSQRFFDFLEKQDGQSAKSGLNIENVDGLLQVEMTDLASRYCTDILAATALGVDSDSFRNPHNELYKMGQLIGNFEGNGALMLLGHLFNPKLMKFLGLPIVRTRALDFFRALTQDLMSSRRKENIIRQDVLQLLIHARNSDEENAKVLDDDTIAAQVMLVFMAGVETVSTLLCFVTNLLAVHQDVQARLKEELQSLAENIGPEVGYEDLHNLKYLDMVIAETLRLYPPVEVIDRKCVKTYTIPGSKTCAEFTFQEGEGLIIPVYSIQHDPDYFENPGRFFPERFNDKNRNRIRPFTYLPFGVGPRNCIGMKFALTLTKLTLFNLFLRYDLHVVDRTPNPIRLAKMCFNKRVDGGFWLGMNAR
ncbi:cytochrome P450 9e2-like [Periplaneta americana]|uniref:cytochrome P450 9e2-like n=1 Tax=Periplaneta americana TaxID=6978 RepID=UPI0037E9B53B